MFDFRSLTAELVKALTAWQCYAASDGPNAELLERANTALEQTAPIDAADRTQFEAWINNPHMLNHREHPVMWGAPEDDCQRHEANPYSHPYTKGAWEAWKACAKLSRYGQVSPLR